MNSFDLFDTLVAARNGGPAGDQPDGWFPIAENIARVRADDIIISDYYNAAGAQAALHLAGLRNDLMVSNDGKATGKAWQTLKALGRLPMLHVGDNRITDVESPAAAGIAAELTTLSRLSAAEQAVVDAFPGLAHLMREARLRTWSADVVTRQLQLFQTQANLPFLFCATVLLHRRLVAGGFRRALLSSRDCWLWLQLFTALRTQLGGSYELVYFLTSRLARYWPSDNYRQYVARLLSVPALVVDLCGFGTSLRYLLPDSPTLLLVGYAGCVTERIVDGWLNEIGNFARHAMVADVDAAGNPVYANPLQIDWQAHAEIAAMHNAFMVAVECAPLYDYTQDFKQSDEALLAVLKQALARMDDYSLALGTMTPFRVAEAQATAALIESRGVLPGGITV